MRRIEASSPPSASFEGRVQQWRDEREDSELEVHWSGSSRKPLTDHDISSSLHPVHFEGRGH
jgi:hypothetical protein